MYDAIKDVKNRIISGYCFIIFVYVPLEISDAD